MTSQEKTKQLSEQFEKDVREFDKSGKTVGDYLQFILSICEVLRPGDGLQMFQIAKILKKVIGD